MTLTVDVSEQTIEGLRREAATAGVTVETIVRERLEDWNPTPEELEMIVAPALEGPFEPYDRKELSRVTEEVLRKCA